MENDQHDDEFDYRDNPVDGSSSYPSALNTEMILAIIAFSISFLWFVLSLFIFKTFSFYLFFIFGMGVLMLILGIYKNNKRKKIDLDF
jgi:hypothetical protein